MSFDENLGNRVRDVIRVTGKDATLFESVAREFEQLGNKDMFIAPCGLNDDTSHLMFFDLFKRLFDPFEIIGNREINSEWMNVNIEFFF